jgi:outer membrane receptor protein involved in Fe transport
MPKRHPGRAVLMPVCLTLLAYAARAQAPDVVAAPPSASPPAAATPAPAPAPADAVPASGAASGAAAPAAPGPVTVLPRVDVIGSTPLLGSGIPRDKVPGATSVLDSADISRDGTPDLVGALNQQVPGVNADSASGNPFQPSLFYHGFEASPLQGTPQGLAVYVNGIRFNQPFGDTVNWDLIPDLAIDSMNLEGSNPVFGLNALGGALNVQLRDGFSYHGGEVDLSGGSFGQILGEAQYGVQSGGTAAYVAASGEHQDGWRDLQSSDIQNFHGDVGWRNDRAELHVTLTMANSVLNGPGTSPVELLDADPRAQFTAPNRISNKYLQFAVNGDVELSDTTSLQALAYYDYFQQIVVNGNAPNDAPCDDGSGLLCSDPGVPSTTRGGAAIPDFLNGGPYSELDDQTTNTNGYGASLQISNTDDLFTFSNQVVAGLSFDGAQTLFDATSYIGGLTPDSRVFIGPGVVIDEPGNNEPVRVAISDAYYGVFLTDTLDLTSRLSLTAAGRFNAAQIDLTDEGGGDLSGNHSYERFNPSIGASYKVTPWLTAYASYAEANRAPTPAELSCASPLDSCSLANFFVGDPDLKQVVAHTVEAGLRGGVDAFPRARLSYNLGFFHTDLDDDILFVDSPVQGRAYFTNIGETQRQGVDIGLQLKTRQWLAYLQYSHIDATFQSPFTENSGDNPGADANGDIFVQKGDRLPGVPANQLKFGVQYHVTPKWTVGAAGIASSGAYLFGDEANLQPQLPAYVTVDLNTQYQATKHIQLFASIQNVTDTKYYTYGTFSPTTAVYLSQAPNASNPRSYSPAAPIGGFGGVRVTF